MLREATCEVYVVKSRQGRGHLVTCFVTLKMQKGRDAMTLVSGCRYEFLTESVKCLNTLTFNCRRDAMAAMVSERDRVKALLTEAVTLLCKNSVTHRAEVEVEGLLGITVDKSDVFLVNLHQIITKTGGDNTAAPFVTADGPFVTLASTTTSVPSPSSAARGKVKRKRKAEAPSPSAALADFAPPPPKLTPAPPILQHKPQQKQPAQIVLADDDEDGANGLNISQGAQNELDSSITSGRQNELGSDPPYDEDASQHADDDESGQAHEPEAEEEDGLHGNGTVSVKSEQDEDASFAGFGVDGDDSSDHGVVAGTSRFGDGSSGQASPSNQVSVALT